MKDFLPVFYMKCKRGSYASSFILWFDNFSSTHVWTKDFRNSNRTIFILIVFKNSSNGTSNSKSRTIQGVKKFNLTVSFITIADLGTTCLETVSYTHLQMAKSNFSIAVDEDNVKDLSTTEWRIIQEIGYGESNKEIAAKLFLSEGTVRNYLSTILSKLNLRDRTQLAIWSVQTGVTRRDFSKGNTE